MGGVIVDVVRRVTITPARNHLHPGWTAFVALNLWLIRPM